MQLRTHKDLYKCIIWIILETWKATYWFCPDRPKATGSLNFSSNTRNEKRKLQCLTETMDYQHLVSGTDTTTAPKFNKASVSQGSWRTTGGVPTKLQSGIWEVEAESSLGSIGHVQTRLGLAFTVQPCWKRRNNSHLSLGTLCFSGIVTRRVILKLAEGE